METYQHPSNALLNSVDIVTSMSPVSVRLLQLNILHSIMIRRYAIHERRRIRTTTPRQQLALSSTTLSKLTYS